MKLPFTTLDVFTTTRYTGNPVSIIRVPATLFPTLTQAQKQAIATEFNLSEIVFLHLPPAATSPSPIPLASSLKIDIFTAHAEVPFAGHPTIGTAFYVLNVLKQDHVTSLITKAGSIPISASEGTGEVSAQIPHDFHIHAKTFFSPLNKAENPVVSIVNGMSFIYVLLPSLDILAEGKENLNVKEYGSTYNPEALDEGWKRGIVCTMYYVSMGEDAFGRKKYRTRMFGSREDPGTGSASCGLACFLAGGEDVGEKVGFVFEQGVEMGRRNVIAVEVEKKADGKGVEGVVLSGAAVTVMEGTLEV